MLTTFTKTRIVTSNQSYWRTKQSCRCQAGPDNDGGTGPQPSVVDPVQTIAWGGSLPSTRRLLLSSIAGTAVVLGGNLGGVTSQLLALDGGQLAESLRLDTLTPVSRGGAQGGPYKRCVDGTFGYEFTYPASWLGDQTVAERAARRAEEARARDLPPLSGPARSRAARRTNVYEPVAAYGPPGGSGEVNLSVVVAPIQAGFSLQSMGQPEQVASQFLSMIAPQASGLEAVLISASSRRGQQPSDQLYYMFEYTVRGPTFYRHNVSVVTARDNLLYTFNAQTPETAWAQHALMLRSSASSFSLTPSSHLGTTGLQPQL